MRGGFRLAPAVLLAATLATPAVAAYGTVKCCLEVSIDDAPARQACIVLNARSHTRPKARARQICRLLGGRPLGKLAA